MPQYAYRAKSGPSQIISGTLQADNHESAVKKLKAEGLFPVSISEIAGKKEKSTHLKKLARRI